MKNKVLISTITGSVIIAIIGIALYSKGYMYSKQNLINRVSECTGLDKSQIEKLQKSELRKMFNKHCTN